MQYFIENNFFNYLLLTAYCLLPTAVFAEDAAFPLNKGGEGVVTVEGNSSMENITKEDARRLAIEDAERNAVEQVAGVTVSADTLVSNFTVSSDVISAIPYGKVIEREILTEDIQVIPPLNASIRGKDETNLPVRSTQTGAWPYSIYHVKMRVKVAKEKGNIDPYFKLDASLNRTVFKDGEDMQLKIKPTKDCYITIFNILEDDSVLTLIPNRHIRDTFIKAKEHLLFPDEDMKKMGINLKVHGVEGKNVQKRKSISSVSSSLLSSAANLKKGSLAYTKVLLHS